MARIKGSRNLKPTKAELYQALEKKSVPYTFGNFDSLMFSPKVINNNPVELLKLNTGIVSVCNGMNASTIASTPLRLFAVKNNNSQKFLYPTRDLNKRQVEAIQIESHSLIVKQAQNIVEITEHPVFDCLNNVNQDGDLNYYDLMEITAGYLGMIGNSYWQIMKNSKGTPVGITVLPAEYTCVKLDGKMAITGYRTSSGVNNDTNYSAEEVIHFLNIAPGVFWKMGDNALRTGVYGMGDAEKVLAEIYLYNAINSYLRAVSENNAIPSGVIKYKNGRLDKNTMEDVTRQWNKVMRNWSQAGKVKVMDQDFEWIPLSLSPKDLDFPEGRRFLTMVIANAWNVPVDLLTTENSNRASSNTAIHNYFRFAIKPRLRRIEERLNSHLMPMFDSKLFLKFDEVIPADQALAITQENNDLRNGTITINEVRKSRGMPEVSWGSEPFVPAKETFSVDTKKPVAPKEGEISKEE